MKRNSNDHKKASEVYGLIYIASRNIANECYDAAYERMNEAMNVIKEHLAQSNLAVDEEAAFGPELPRPKRKTL